MGKGPRRAITGIVARDTFSTAGSDAVFSALVLPQLLPEPQPPFTTMCLTFPSRALFGLFGGQEPICRGPWLHVARSAGRAISCWKRLECRGYDIAGLALC